MARGSAAVMPGRGGRGPPRRPAVLPVPDRRRVTTARRDRDPSAGAAGPDRPGRAAVDRRSHQSGLTAAAHVLRRAGVRLGLVRRPRPALPPAAALRRPARAARRSATSAIATTARSCRPRRRSRRPRRGRASGAGSSGPSPSSRTARARSTRRGSGGGSSSAGCSRARRSWSAGSSSASAATADHRQPGVPGGDARDECSMPAGSCRSTG